MVRPVPGPELQPKLAEQVEAYEALEEAGEIPDSIEPGTPEHEPFASFPSVPLSAFTDEGGLHIQPDEGAGAVAPAAFIAMATVQCSTLFYCASYSVSAISVTPTFYQPGIAPVTITNGGTKKWDPSEVRLTYRLYDANQNLMSGINTVSTLPGTVQPGQTVSVNGVIGSLAAGRYYVAWDMVILNTAYPVAKTFTQLGAPATGNVINFAVPVLDPIAQPSQPDTDNSTITEIRPTFAVFVQADGTKAIAVQMKICIKSACQSSNWISATITDFSAQVAWEVPSGYLHWNTPATFSYQVRNGTTSLGWSVPLRVTPVVTQPASSGLGSNPGYLDDQGVNLRLGQFVQQEAGLSLPGVRGNAEVARTYNSADSVNHAYGVGWSSLLDSSWAAAADGSITVRLPDGQSRRYAYDPSDGGRWWGGFGDPTRPYLNTTTRELTVNDVTYGFDTSTGKIIKIRVAEGRALDLHIGTGGLVDWVAEAKSGRRVYLTWVNGHVATESTQAGGSGLLWTYGYSGNLLTKVCDARGASSCTTYTYGAGTRMASITPPASRNTVALTYTTEGAVKTLGRPDGVWTYNRLTPSQVEREDGEALIIEVSDPRTTNWYSYDTRGALLYRWNRFRVRQNAYTTSYGYGLNGLLSYVVDQNENITQYSYDAIVGKVNVVGTWRDGVTYLPLTYEYRQPVNGGGAGVGQLLRRTGLREACTGSNGCEVQHNTTTTYVYGANGLLISENEPVRTNGVATTAYAYTCGNDGLSAAPAPINDLNPGTAKQPCGLLASETNPAGLATTYAYNHFGDLTRKTTPTGEVVDMVYNDLGRITSKTVATPQTSAGATTTYTYDAVGNLTTQVDPDVVNPVTGVHHQLKTVNTFDVAGNLVSTTESDAANPNKLRVITRDYDSRNRPMATSVDGALVSHTTYNPFGQPTETYDGRFSIRQFTYTINGQLSEEKAEVSDPYATEVSSWSVIAKAYTYDRGGRIATRTDAMGEPTYYTYTADNLLREEYQLTSVGRKVVRHSYTYDLDGNRTGDTVGSGDDARTTFTTYDDGSATSTATFDPQGLNRKTTFGYDAAGRQTAAALTDGTRTETTSKSYNSVGQLDKVQVENGADDLTTDYDYDAWGNIVGVTDPRGSSAIGSTAAPKLAYMTNRTYDALGRLATESKAPSQVDDGTGAAATLQRAVTTYGYDEFGNVSEVKDPGGAITHYEYDSRDQRIAEWKPPIDPGVLYSSILAADAPLSWWKFSDTTSTVADATGTRTGTTTSTGRALVTGASPFDGGTQATQFSAPNTGASIPSIRPLLSNTSTLELWFKIPSDLSREPHLLSSAATFLFLLRGRPVPLPLRRR